MVALQSTWDSAASTSLLQLPPVTTSVLSATAHGYRLFVTIEALHSLQATNSRSRFAMALR